MSASQKRSNFALLALALSAFAIGTTDFLMGLFAFMNVPGLQVYVVMLAERYVPSAVDTASAINIAAFNAGIAIGAVLGGTVADSIGLIHTPWIGAVMVFGAVLLSAWSRSLEQGTERKASAVVRKSAMT